MEGVWWKREVDIGGSRRALGSRPPPSPVQFFFQFHAVFRGKNAKAIGWPPVWEILDEPLVRLMLCNCYYPSICLRIFRKSNNMWIFRTYQIHRKVLLVRIPITRLFFCMWNVIKCTDIFFSRIFKHQTLYEAISFKGLESSGHIDFNFYFQVKHYWDHKLNKTLDSKFIKLSKIHLLWRITLPVKRDQESAHTVSLSHS